ncbi:MAG: hypothetical protein LKJ95_10990 [Bacteroidales bacterium]|nr:hypothetical protein [Bacteroidales bacterium]
MDARLTDRAMGDLDDNVDTGQMKWLLVQWTGRREDPWEKSLCNQRAGQHSFYWSV